MFYKFPICQIKQESLAEEVSDMKEMWVLFVHLNGTLFPAAAAEVLSIAFSSLPGEWKSFKI